MGDEDEKLKLILHFDGLIVSKGTTRQATPRSQNREIHRSNYDARITSISNTVGKKETVSCVVRHSDHDQLDYIKIPALLSQDSVPLGKVIVSLNLIFFI